MGDHKFEQVCTLMHLGYPPSMIDRFLGIPKGSAHDMVVDSWVARNGGLPEGHDPDIESRFTKFGR